MNILKQIYNRLCRREMFVILDPEDSTVTISKGLYKHIDKHFTDAVDVFMFHLPGMHCYGFTVNPVQNGWITEEELHGTSEGKRNPAVSELCYNSQVKSIGFAAACPTVALMLTELDLPLVKTKMTVKADDCFGNLVYIICH